MSSVEVMDDLFVIERVYFIGNRCGVEVAEPIHMHGSEYSHAQVLPAPGVYSQYGINVGKHP